MLEKQSYYKIIMELAEDGEAGVKQVVVDKYSLRPITLIHREATERETELTVPVKGIHWTRSQSKELDNILIMLNLLAAESSIIDKFYFEFAFEY
ncbi:hypothetical protein LISE100100_00425 [Listeria seeligeri]|uniref:hypothetical protein n=1 Tax=Listeria seeligeri TaxID=1640 RepID=UPI0001C4EC3F|nr:hypothetical protein [Listeria seeligeri]CBH27739.1 hypothetical protein lse_1588 [Listeria seeligeri serovar 1/2b str. SLCC3954]